MTHDHCQYKRALSLHLTNAVATPLLAPNCGFRPYQKMAAVVRFLLLAIAVAPFFGSLLVASFACPSLCTCRWKGDKETAECVNHRLKQIPEGLSRGIQVLDISKNNLRLLEKDTFLNAGLLNLQKLYISDCKIRKIDDSAFSRLANLVELDLGLNLLIQVPSETFVDYPELRRLILNKNPIRRIESKAFVKLPYLALLEISSCFLEYVGPKAFQGLNNLQHLKLDDNRLTSIPADVGFPIKSLRSLDILDNPWSCDCDLRILRNWLSNDQLPVNAQPICAQPERLEGRWLIRVQPEEFACLPEASSYSSVVEASLGESAKLVCSVQADPPPAIHWFRHGKPITNLSRIAGRSHTFVIHERGLTDRMSILTISAAGEEDSGEYSCFAENLAGQITINVTLDVVQRSVEASSLTNGHIAGISIALILVSVVTIVFICVLLTKMRQQHSEETKHLDLQDKGKNAHAVNHVKFDVTKEKLEMTTTANSVHKPLCSVVNSNYNSSTPCNQDKIHLEDAIGGAYRMSSRISGNKPDVVNFTCVLTSPVDNDDSDRDKLMIKGNGSSSSSEKLQEKLADFCRRSPSLVLQDGGDHFLPRVFNAEYPDYDAPKERYFSSKNRTESRETLCDYVQLYDESARDARRDNSDMLENSDPGYRDNDERIKEDGARDWCSANICDSNVKSPVKPWYDSVKNPMGEQNPSAALDEKEQEDSPRGSDSWIKNNDVPNHSNNSSSNNNGSAMRHCNKLNKVPPPVPSRRYGPLGNASGMMKHANLHGRNYVPVLPPLPVHHFAQARDSPDEGYEDEVEEEIVDM